MAGRGKARAELHRAYLKEHFDEAFHCRLRGTACTIAVDRVQHAIIESPGNLMAWQGLTNGQIEQADNLVEKYDCRALLDTIDEHEAKGGEDPGLG
jgi:hypothetical protein